jgi:uncharacterized protein (TIGR00369 family)
MTGNKPDRLNDLLAMFNQRAPIAHTFGMQLSFNQQREAIVDLPYNPALDHAQGGIHGGIYATLLDSAGWFAAAASHAEQCWIATSEMSIHFLRPSARTALRAVGRVLKAGKRQDVVEMWLYAGEQNLVGHATGTFMVLPGVELP